MGLVLTRTFARFAILCICSLLVGSVGFVREASATAVGTSAQSGCGSELPVGAVVVGMAATASGDGYWEVDQFGDVAVFGNASCFGALTSVALNEPIVGMATTPSGNGYWMVAADGGIFSFGNAALYGRATVSAPPSCTSAQLSAAPGRSGVAAGSRAQQLILQNTSTAKCTLYGYPGMLMLNSSGHPLPTHVSRSATHTEKTIVLVPGDRASFLAHWADSTGYGGERCPTSSQVKITPPNAYKPITIPLQITPYGGTTSNLECGQIIVSVVYAGTTLP